MPRRIRNSNLDTREARLKLAPGKKYWTRTGARGVHLGYRRGSGKQSGVWWRRDWKGGGYRERSLRCAADDFSEANGESVLDYWQALDRVQGATAAEPSRVEPSRYSVGAAMGAYLEYLESEGTPSSYREARIAIEAHIKPKLGEVAVADLVTTLSDGTRVNRVEEWKRGLVKAALRRGQQRIKVDKHDADAVRKRRATANRILTYLKAGLNKAHETHHFPNSDAWREVKPFKGADAPRIRYLSRDDAIRLLAKCPDDFRQLVRGALLTGARYSEIRNARVRDYDLDSETLLVRHTKTHSARHIPLTREGVQFFNEITAGRAGEDIMFQRADGETWGTGHQTRRLREACEAADIDPPIGFHILRHTYATWLVRKGTSLRFVSEAIGASVRMVERHYGHVAPTDLKKAVQQALPKGLVARKSNVARLR